MFAFWIGAVWLAGCRPAAVAPDVPAADAAANVVPLRIGTSGDYPPFSDRSEPEPASSTAASEQPAGFSIEVARAFARHQGRPVEWIPFRWAALSSDLDAGRFDLVLSGVTVRPDRSVSGRFSLPLTTSGAVVLVDADLEIASHTELDRPETRIAVNAGGHLERVARRLFPKARIAPVPDNGDVLRQIDRADTSAILTDTLEAPLWQRRRPGLRAIGPLTRDRKAAWFPIGAEARVEGFDDWLIAAEADGTLARLRARHGLADNPTATPTTALLSSLDERLSLMVAVAETKRVQNLPIENIDRERRVLDAAVEAVRAARQRENPTTGGPARSETEPVPSNEAAVRRLYRAQIEAAKWIQHRSLAQSGPQTTSSPEAVSRARAKLESSLRPALIFLGDRIARLIVLASEDEARAPAPAVLARALARHDLSEPILSELQAALAEVLAPRRRETD